MKEAKLSSHRGTPRKKIHFSIGKTPVLVVDRLQNLNRLPKEFSASGGESRINFRTQSRPSPAPLPKFQRRLMTSSSWPVMRNPSCK